MVAEYDIYSFGWYLKVDPENYLAGRYTYKLTLLDFDVEIDAYTSEFWIVDTCAENLTLNGLQDNGTRFADQWIDSRQLLVPNSNVKYRAGGHVLLKPGFYARTNTKFQAKLDFQCPN